MREDADRRDPPNGYVVCSQGHLWHDSYAGLVCPLSTCRAPILPRDDPQTAR